MTIFPCTDPDCALNEERTIPTSSDNPLSPRENPSLPFDLEKSETDTFTSTTFIQFPLCHGHHRQIFYTCLRYPHPPQNETFVTIPILVALNLSRIPQRRPPPLSLCQPLIGANSFLFSVVHPVLHIPTNPAPPIFIHPPTNTVSSLSGTMKMNPRLLRP